MKTETIEAQNIKVGDFIKVSGNEVSCVVSIEVESGRRIVKLSNGRSLSLQFEYGRATKVISF